MQLLERISFLLRSPAAAAAASPLLLILQTYARAGADAARAVWQCPGMLKAVQGLLQSTLPLAGDAMAVLRLLASSSSQMMKAVASSGKKLLLLLPRQTQLPPTRLCTGAVSLVKCLFAPSGLP